MLADRPTPATSLRPFSRPLSALAPIALVALALLPATAAADPPSASRPAADLTLAELQAIGLGQYRGNAIPVPDEAPRERAPGQPPLHASQGRIFVNFDGANLTNGWDDATNDVTQIGELAGSFAAYGAGDKREAVMQAVRADWAPFNVLITDTRPASGSYTMNMTGPTNPFGGGVLGIAPLDCDDSQTHDNITYAFHSVGDSFSAAVTATTIGQEVAHSYGLEHVDQPNDVMNPYNAGGDAAFLDTCITIVQGVACGTQHAAECGDAGQQNSYAELMTLFGPSNPDTAAPTVEITYPADGATFPTDSDFTITVEANDDQSVEQVTLYSNAAEQGTDPSTPYGWDVSNIPAGTYELYVVATDAVGNETTSATITISVGDDLPPSGDEGGADEGGAEGGESDGGADDGADGSPGGESDGGADDGPVATDDGSLPPGYGLDDGLGDPGTCACKSGSNGAGSTFGLLVLVLAGALRRRR
jgi:MYXO-CTERM domain-containing protein